MKNLLVLFISIAIAISSLSVVSAATYEFYHVAVRDFNGDGHYNDMPGYNADRIRYGFKYTPDPASGVQLQARLYGDDINGNPTNELQRMDVNKPWLYKESYNGSAWVDERYDAVNFLPANDTQWYSGSDVRRVELFTSIDGGATWDSFQNHMVNLPDTSSQFSAYDGIDVHNVSWEILGDGSLKFNWAAPGANENWDYRFTLSGEFGGQQYDFLNYLTGNETSTILGADLLAGLGNEWGLQFQQRFHNTDFGVDNGTWIRSYSDWVNIDISSNGTTAPVPIPASILLLGSGIIGLVGFKRRRKI